MRAYRTAWTAIGLQLDVSLQHASQRIAATGGFVQILRGVTAESTREGVFEASQRLYGTHTAPVVTNLTAANFQPYDFESF